VLSALLLGGKFLFMVALAKWTTPATVGVYALVVTVGTMLIYLIGLELHSYTTREVVSCEDRGEQAYHLQSHFRIILVTYGLSLPLASAAFAWTGIDGHFSFALFALVLLGEVLCHELGRYLIILSKPVASRFQQLLRSAAWMPAAVILIARLPAGEPSPINTILACWAIGTTISVAFGLWHVRRLIWPLQPFSVDWGRQAFGSTRHYFAVALLTQVQSYADRFIIQFNLGEAQVGLLSFYQSFANTLLTFVQTGVVAILLPRLLHAVRHSDAPTAAAIRRRMWQGSVGLALVISLGLIIAMPFLLDQLHRPEYTAILPIFYGLLLGNLLMVAGLVPHFQLYAERRDALLMQISAITTPCAVVANLVAVPMFGLPGAVTVFAATAALQLALKIYFARHAIAEGREILC
jgi:O-antigen/teichoic acid export membrane protein